MNVIDLGLLALLWMNILILFLPMLLDLIGLNIDLGFDLNLIYLDIDISLILVTKKLVCDNEYFTMNLCVNKKPMVITSIYIINKIRFSERYPLIPCFRLYLLLEPTNIPSLTHLPNHLFQ